MTWLRDQVEFALLLAWLAFEVLYFRAQTGRWGGL
jgi:hypothetical protein